MLNLLKDGAKTIQEETERAFGLWEEGKIKDSLGVLYQLEEDCETLKIQIQRAKLVLQKEQKCQK